MYIFHPASAQLFLTIFLQVLIIIDYKLVGSIKIAYNPCTGYFLYGIQSSDFQKAKIYL